MVKESDKFSYFAENFFDEIFKTFISNNYVPQSKFKYQQKIAILNYLYTKNAQDMLKPREHNLEHAQNKKQQLQFEIEKLDKLEYHNRIFFIQEMMNCQIKQRNLGYLYGSIFGLTFYTFFQKMSKIRKSAICLTIAISGGAISLYRVTDRVFDQLFVFFKDDSKIYLKNDQKSQAQTEAGKIKKTEIDILIEELKHQNSIKK